MALDRNDIALLIEAKNNGLDIDQIIEWAEKKVAQNELEKRLNKIWKEIYYKFNKVVRDNIDKISEMTDEEEILDFVIKESYRLYKEEQENIDNQEKLEK